PSGGGFAVPYSKFKVDKFKTTSRSQGPNAGLSQVRAYTSTTTAVQTPFNQYNWPNLPYVSWYQHWQQGVQQRRPVTFNNLDWPNPSPVQWYREWSGVNAMRMARQPASFFNNQDWPNPPSVLWYRDFSLNLLETTLKPAQQNPVVQSDWPVPPPVTWYRDYSF